MLKHGTIARGRVVILNHEGYGLRPPHSQWMRGKIIFRFAENSDEATSLEPRGEGGLPAINQIKSNQIKSNPGVEQGEVVVGGSEKGGFSEGSLSQLIHIPTLNPR
jgi:hypothetical protein